MRKLFTVFIQLLAINFLLIAGAVGWLYKSGRLDKPRIAAIREILFPPDAPPPAAPTTQPAGEKAENEVSARLDALLKQYSGRRAGEQVELIQQTFDAQSAQLDRKAGELAALQRQVAEQQQRLAEAAAQLEKDRTALATRENKLDTVALDKGFQDSLKLYTSMSGKQAKDVFMTLPDETVVAFLRAMPPRTATKIIKEFKSPEEQQRVNLIMERLRLADAASSTTRPASTEDIARNRPINGT